MKIKLELTEQQLNHILDALWYTARETRNVEQANQMGDTAKEISTQWTTFLDDRQLGD